MLRLTPIGAVVVPEQCDKLATGLRSICGAAVAMTGLTP